MAIDLLVKGVWLDMREGEEKRFFINKSLHDLREMFGRNSDRSKTITIPRTPRNISVLQEHSAALGTDYKVLGCQLYMGGVPVLEDAALMITGEDFNHYEVTILGGAATFYYLLSDSSISSLDFSADNFEWTLANFITRVTAGGNVQTGFAQWLSNSSWSQYLANSTNQSGEEAQATDIDKAGFFYMAKALMSKIFANVGLSLDASAVESAYEDVAIVCPMAQVYEAEVDGVSAFGEVKFNAIYTVPAGSTRLAFDKVVFNSGIWNTSLFQFEITESAEFIISSQFIIWLPNDNPDITFFLYKENPSDVPVTRELIESVRVTDTNWHTMENRIVVNAGEIVYMTTTPLGGGGQKLASSSNFSMRSVGGTSNYVLVNEWLPDISQREFVKNIFNMFHIVAATTNGKVNLSFFKDIEPNGQIDLGHKVAVDRQVKYIPRLSNYAQRNIFKYATEERILSTSFNATIEIPDNTLPKLLVKIELFFSSMDYTLFSKNKGGVAPAYDTYYNEEKKNKLRISGSSGTFATYTTDQSNSIRKGDIIWIINGGTTSRFVVRRIFDNKNGELNYTLAINENDQDWTHMSYERSDYNHQLARLFVDDSLDHVYYQGSDRQVTAQPVTKSAHAITWDGLIEDYYKDYVRMIQDFQVLQVWVDIPSTIFMSLNSLKPIYMVGNKYYLNKTEQFKENGLVRLELIRFN